MEKTIVLVENGDPDALERLSTFIGSVTHLFCSASGPMVREAKKMLGVDPIITHPKDWLKYLKQNIMHPKAGEAIFAIVGEDDFEVISLRAMSELNGGSPIGQVFSPPARILGIAIDDGKVIFIEPYRFPELLPVLTNPS